jgi:hypothetical protein
VKTDPIAYRMSEELISNIITAVGFPHSAGWRRIFHFIFQKPTHNLASIGLTFDQLIQEAGLRKAAEWALQHWCSGIQASKQGEIPAEGPLMILSNHPGAYDALAITSQITRPDLNIIASDLYFLRNLPNFSQRIFFIPLDKNQVAQRMAGLLASIRYLKRGGSVLLMGSGTIDPDPAVSPGAIKNVNLWTDAVTMVIRSVPEVQVILTAVSNVLSRKWAHHPLTWLRKGGMEKRRLAEFGQVLHQLFKPGRLVTSPRLTFSPVITSNQLGSSPRTAILEREAALLMDHCQEFGGQL